MATQNSPPSASKASLSSAVKARKTPVKAGTLPEIPEAKVITPMGWMHTARFLTTAAELFHLPALDVPEIAFVGRSNAGKSTCINTLTQQKQLAFASKKPGRTQHINLFSLGKQGVTDAVLADLPGYGYAHPIGRREGLVDCQIASRWRSSQTFLSPEETRRGRLGPIDVGLDAHR